ncbi:MAG: tetratricopeptide repeat protein [Myxococcales bacterium]|nr:tetratricopeptide repeat protein [Myxococcales bacterium]
MAAAPTTAPEAPVCIAPELEGELAACTRKPGARTRAKASAPALRLPDSAKLHTPEASPPGSHAPGYTLDPERRAGRAAIQRRKRALLTREIVLVERLAKRGRPGDPRAAKVLMRLAQLYFELSKEREHAGRELDDAIANSCRRKAGDRARCQRTRKAQKAAFEARDKARVGNIRALGVLLRDHPGYPKVDEVLFALGFALEEMDQRDRARTVYHRLIRQHPQSPHVPRAYLSFAEHYFHLGDMGAARRFYEKVTEIPAERNPVHGYALYKQAWCRYNLDDFSGALKLLVETIELAQARPEDRELSPLLVQARRELVLPYAQVGHPKKALPFFERYARDREQALQIYEQLGELYYDLGRWPEARAVYHGLMADAPDSSRMCPWQQRVTETVLASGHKRAQATEVERLIDLYQDRRDREAERRICREAAASTAIELAVAWHREAIGTDTQPGTRDRKTMALAADLYDAVFEAFESFAGIEFARMDRRDWPTRYSLGYYRAELAWQMGQYEACGPAFDRVLAIDPAGPLTEDAAYGAVLCYDRVYRARYKPIEGKGLDSEDAAEKLTPRALSKLEREMLAAFERYLCYVPEGEEALRIQYRRARIYYDARHFEQAAELFRQVAFDRSGDALARVAANLYLDSLNVLSVLHEGRQRACYATMERALDPLSKLHCAAGGDGDSGALCEVVGTLRCQLLRKRAEGQQAAGDHRAAAETYVRIARRHGSCDGRDEVLYNAAIHFEAARLLGRAIKVRTVLIDQHPDSKWTARARYLLGSNYHALAFYERAADHYEDFARRHPRDRGHGCSAQEREADLCPDASRALSNAIFFRLGLGDEGKAAESAALFERSYRRRDPRAASRVRFALGSIYERNGDHERVARHYRAFVRDYGRHALPHELAQAHLKVGLALTARGDHRGARPSFASVLKVHADGAPRLAKLEGFDEPERARFGALSRVAAAEASFHQGEESRRAFEAIAFPRLRLPSGGRAARSAAFKRWLDEDFKRWIADKAKALAHARGVYEAVDAHQAPPWSIAAAARVGDMYLAFVDAFRDAPVPPALERDQELIDIYHEELDTASQPWVEQAKQAYRFCLETATRVRWFNRYLSHCEQELFSLDPRGYPKAAELRLARPLTHTAMAEPSLAVLRTDTDGEEEVGP